MPGVRLQDVDQATGMIINGPYAGYKFDEVQEFLENRAAAAPPLSGGGSEAAGGTPPSGGTPPAGGGTKPKTPEEELAARADQRVEGISQAVTAQNARLESDDEDAFAATVTDYDKEFGQSKQTIRQLVAGMKKAMAPAQRIQRGIHRQLYMMVKQQDPEIQKRIFGQPDPTPPPDGEPPVEGATEETPPAAAVPPVAAQPPSAPRTPKPAPAAAAPTPPNRGAAPPKEKQPKLKGNEKTERAARAFGIPHDKYLLRLEEDGTTQDVLDAMTINRKAPGGPLGRRPTVYDR